MKCLKFPAKDCDLLTCQTKGKCLWHDEFGATPKEPEAVHGNEAEKGVCEHLQIIDLGDGVSQCRKCYELFDDD